MILSYKSPCPRNSWENRNEASDAADELTIVLAEFQQHSCSNRSCLGDIFESQRISGEESLVDDRLLELLAGCVPTVFVMCDIDGVVDEQHSIVGRFVLECVAVLLPKLEDLRNDAIVGVRDFDRVSLDVRNGVSFLLNEMLQVDHEQSAALGDDVVHVPGVSEWVVEFGGGESVRRIQCDLQRIGQGVEVRFIIKIWSQRPIQDLTSLVEFLVLDQDTSLLELAVPLGVWSEQLEILDRRWVHRRNIQQGHVLIVSRLGGDVSALADLLAAICRLAVLVLVAGEHLRQVCVLQVLLSVPLTLEYDLSGQLVGAGVDGETCYRS